MATGSVKRMWPAVLMAVLVVALAFFAMGASRTVIVGCGEDLDAVVNADPAATATRFQLSGCTYHVDNTVQPEDGDEIAGPVGTFIMRGPAYDPEPLATIQGSATLGQVMKPRGTFHGDWLQIFGGDFDGTAGSGVGLAGGDMDSDSVIYATQVANNEGAGVSNFHGLFWRSELTNNTTNPDALGFIGSGLKAVDEVWVGESYVHDTQGNGIWCDEECNDQPLSNGKFTVWYSLIANNGRDGVRWEKVGDEATHGEALVYLNEIHGNGVYERRAGVGVRTPRTSRSETTTSGLRPSRTCTTVSTATPGAPPTRAAPTGPTSTTSTSSTTPTTATPRRGARSPPVSSSAIDAGLLDSARSTNASGVHSAV